MITGDNKDTAEAVADLVHIREGFDKTFPSYTGKEFEALSASEKMKVLSSRKPCDVVFDSLRQFRLAHLVVGKKRIGLDSGDCFTACCL